MTEEMVAYGTYEVGRGRLGQCAGMSPDPELGRDLRARTR
jgi:hypothetical protein